MLDIIAGEQPDNSIPAILQGFQSGQIQDAYNQASNADGTALMEQERWMESLEAKTKQCGAAFQSMFHTVADSDLSKSFIDLGTTGASALDGIIKELGLLPTVLAGAGIASFVKNLDRQKALKIAWSFKMV